MQGEQKAVLGIDVGTTSVKAVVTNSAGEVVAEAASEAISTRSPEPGAAEQEPVEIWAALVQAVRAAVAQAVGHDILAMAPAAQSGSLVPIGAQGKPGPAILWMDTRSRALVDSWGEGSRGRIRQISGWTPSTGLGLSSAAWLGAQGSCWSRLASVDDYVMYRLTGQWATNPSNAAGMQLMDVALHEWSEELCAIAGVAISQLSTIEPSGNIVGQLLGSSSAELGLSPQVLVLAGGHDQACAAHGLAVRDPGSVLLSGGTAWVVTTPTDRADPSKLPVNVNLSPHVRPERWTVSQSLGALGAVIAWWRDHAYEQPAQLDSDLSEAASGADVPLFIPALQDERRTAWGRFESGGDSRPERARAVIETAAFEVRRALASLTPVAGDLTALTLVGGAANSKAVAQVLADVLGLQVTVQRGASWPARGAALLAADSLGWAPNAGRIHEPITVAPHPSAASALGDRYDVYCHTTSSGRERGSQ